MSHKNKSVFHFTSYMHNTGTDVLRAVLLKIQVLCAVTPCCCENSSPFTNIYFNYTDTISVLNFSVIGVNSYRITDLSLYSCVELSNDNSKFQCSHFSELFSQNWSFSQ
jgi:hypothetical protein